MRMKPSEACALELSLMVKDIHLSLPTLAVFIAKHSGCDKGYVEPEPAWRKEFPLPWDVRRSYPDVEDYYLTASNNGRITSAVGVRQPIKMQVFEHIVHCVHKIEVLGIK